MANHKSAKKRILTTERNRTRNSAAKSAIRTAIKAARLAKQKGSEDLTTLLSKTFSLIDRAILKGIMHKNTGARYKSNLSKPA